MNLLNRSSHVYGQTFMGGSNHAGRWEVRVLTLRAKCLNVGTAGAISKSQREHLGLGQETCGDTLMLQEA